MGGRSPSGAGGRDRYRRVRRLGEGASGQVWLVEDSVRRDSEVALKELTETTRGREDSLRHEFAALHSLHHPNLVEVHDFDVSPESGLPRFSLEYIEGLDLVTTVQQEGPDSFATLAAESLRALAFLHDYGLVHRDLKPGNLLVRSKARGGCRVVVLDFGLALRGDRAPGEQQKEEEDRDEERSPAQPAGPAGTLPYLAPELFESTEADHRSDLYGLGAVLFEAIHGRPPFDPEGKDPGEFIQQVRDGRRSRPPVPEGYPAGLAGWLEGLLSPDPADRPAGARDALAGLNDAGGFKLPAELPITRAARLASGRPVGRDLELEQLWSNLSNDERPRLVWLCGDAGSGKTRLARWVAGEAVGRGWDVVVGLSDEQTRDREAADAALRDLRDRAAKRSTLLLIDEAENARSGVVRLLERVAREGKAPPLRVVAALRPVEIQHPAVRKLLADTELVPTLKRVDLQQLDAPGVRAMAERATGNPSISETRLKWLLKTAEGNPLLTEDLLVEGTWEKRGKEKRSAAELLAGSVSARLATLSENGQRLLEALAVLERPSALDVVAAVADLGSKAAARAAREVETAGLGSESGNLWASASRSISARILADQSSEQLRRLYRRAAETLQEQHGSDPLQRAGLWFGAGENGRATALALDTAREIDEKKDDPAEAAQAYALALRSAGRGHPRRYEMRKRQAEALFEAGLYPEAVRAAGAAIRLADNPSRLSAALFIQSQGLTSAGKYERALHTSERAIRVAMEAEDSPAIARAEKAKGTVLGRMNRDREAVPVLRSAIRALERIPRERRTWIEAVHTLGVLRDRNLEPDSRELLKTAMESADETNYPRIQVFARLALSTVLRGDSLHDQASTLLKEAGEIADKLTPSALQHLVAFKRAQQAQNHDQFEAAIRFAEEAEDSAWHFGDENFAVRARSRRAAALTLAGRSLEAVRLLKEALRFDVVLSQTGLQDVVRVGLAEALLEGPEVDHDQVREILAVLISNSRAANNRSLIAGSLLLEAERRALPESSEAVEPVLREFEALASTAALRAEYVVRATIAHAKGAAKGADFDLAAKLAGEAAETAEKEGIPSFVIRAKIVKREALRQLGRHSEADEVLMSARESVQTLAGTIQDPDLRHAFLNQPVLNSLRETSPLENAADERLQTLYEMIRILNSEQDPEALLNSMLDMALRAARAQRGLVLLRDLGREEPTFSVRSSRGVERETEEDAASFSRSVVARAGRGESILAVDAGSDERFRDLRSVSLYHIRSLMCVPLRSRGTIIGTVYLDSRKDGSLFTEADLRFVEAFADHAALALENARSRARLEAENKRLRAAVEERVNFDNIIGRSPAMQRVFDLIEKVAASELPVLIQGESGTGKELVARAVHHHGSRKNKVFLSENCAAIPETLLESELFGHVRGAFTGAERDRAGLFEQAHGGTLFLDEIGDMSPAMQARLLRVLQEGELRRVGGDATIEVDVRVLAATHRDLQQRVKEGSFREDLLYRLQVLTIQLPPLRDRAGDIPRLIDHLVERISRERDREQPEIAPDVMDLLERYAWPGNVRQLENVIQRLALLAGDGAITRAAIDSDANLRDALSDQPPSGDAMFSLERSERDQIQRALDVSEGNRNKAARMLGISRATIYRKIKEYGLR